MRSTTALPLCLLITALYAQAQVLSIQDMSTEQIRLLDRNKTAVILPGGILEEHGPYLAAFTDGYLSQRVAADLASGIAARPGWKALVFPQIPLGAEGYNFLGARASFPGSYVVRSSTLRAVFMDLASQLGEQGFRWIFIVHVHGAGLHNRALDQASDFFHDTYGGRMVHLWGLAPVIGAWGKVLETLPDAAKHEDGVSLHSGMDETSLMLYLRPKLVAPNFERAPIHTGATLEESMSVAHEPEWPGYVGSPRLGKRQVGERIATALSRAAVEYTLKVLDGADPAQYQRYGDLLSKVPAYVKVDENALEAEKAAERKQSDWLREKGLR